MIMKRKAMKALMIAAIALTLSIPLNGFAQQNNNTATGQMKESGSEVSKAGKSMARHARRGRVVKGGKHFGKHMGRAGRHFGRGAKKVVKRAVA
jgi:hypothetical protein